MLALWAPGKESPGTLPGLRPCVAGSHLAPLCSDPCLGSEGEGWGGLSSLRNMIPPSAPSRPPSPGGWGHSSASCLFPVRPGAAPPPPHPAAVSRQGLRPRSQDASLGPSSIPKPASGDLEAFWNKEGAGPEPCTSLAQSPRMPALELDRSHAQEELFTVLTDVLRATPVKTDTSAVLSFRGILPLRRAGGFLPWVPPGASRLWE